MTSVGKRRFRNLKIARNALLFTFRANKIYGTAFFAARKIRRGKIFLFCYLIVNKLFKKNGPSPLKFGMPGKGGVFIYFLLTQVIFKFNKTGHCSHFDHNHAKTSVSFS